MGLFEEPRYVIQSVCNNFFDMPPGAIREQTFCCGGGSGLNAGEDMELRFRGGLPRANAVKYVHKKYGVNMLANVCAIDRAVLPALMEYYIPEVDVTGVHEMVGNALIMEGEKKREVNYRGEPLPGMEDSEDV
jgi:Fe-S oxidoreductase